MSFATLSFLQKETSLHIYQYIIYIHQCFRKHFCLGGNGEDHLREDKILGKPGYQHTDEKVPKLVD